MKNRFLNKETFFQCFSLLLPFLVYLFYYVNTFYHYGDTVLDSGWFIYLSTHFSSFSLQNPPVLFPTHLGETYLNTHVSFIFAIFSFFYEFLFFWISPEIYFSLLLASFYALLSLSGFLFLSYLQTSSFVALLLSILIAFNGQSLAMTGFAHFEIAIASLMMLFFVLYFKGQVKLSGAVFVLLLLTREDAGLHFFGFVFVFAFIEYIKTASLQRLKYLFLFAFAALAYSIAVILMQKLFFHVDDAFTRIYAGSDFFGHLNAEFLANRALFLLENRAYLYVPAVLLFGVAFFTKNYYLLVSVLSIIPWTLLSVCAVNDMPGTLSNYYAYLFILLFAWIPVAFFLHARLTAQKWMIWTLLSVTISSIVLFPGTHGNVYQSPWKRVFIPNSKEIVYTHKIKAYLKEHKARLGNILFDEAVSLLTVETLRFDEYLYINTFSKNEVGKKQRENFTTLIFKENSSKELMHTLIKEKSMQYIYRVKHTDIVIASLQKIPKADFLIPHTLSLRA